MDLIERSNNLCVRAEDIFNNLKLDSFFSNVLDINIVGSAEYNLMTWEDLDVDIITKDLPTDKQLFDLAQGLFSISNISKLVLVDNRSQIELNRPKSMYMGCTYLDDLSDVWKIDIRLLSKDDVTTNKISKLITKKLTPRSRQVILGIKSQVHDNPLYHNGFSSVDIYEAVLNEEVEDIDSFKSYLNKLGRDF